MATKKNPHAVALGSIGGKAKVPKGFSTLNPEERSRMAQAGVKARRKKKGKKAK